MKRTADRQENYKGEIRKQKTGKESPLSSAVAHLGLVRSMDTTSVFRALLVIRGGWAILEWFFDLGPQRIDSFSVLHPLASLFAHAVAVAFLLVILAGLWFFHRWARFFLALLLAVAVFYSAFRPHHLYLGVSSSLFVMINLLVLVFTVAIVTMSFLPPVRDKFATQT